jgi:hypothetical protein
VRFQPKTESEIQEENPFTPWPPGVYDFEVAESEERTSKSGNDMIALTIKVYNKDGESRTVFDYLLPSILYKLKHAAEACGNADKYERGELTSVDFYGKTGKLKLRVDPPQNGYAAKNAVQDYVVDARKEGPSLFGAPKQREPVGVGDLDDEIPF